MFAMRENVKLSRVRNLASKLTGDPRSVFYGDATVSIDPEDVSAALGHEAPANEVVEQAIVSDEPNELVASEKLAAYNAMPASERAGRTLLPALACWNAMIIINPMLGKVLANALDYMLLKALNDYPYEGKTFSGEWDGDARTWTIVINSEQIAGTGTIAGKYIAIPFFRFTIAASTLNAAPGSQISLDIIATNAEGRQIDTKAQGYTFSFQRLNNTEAIVGVYIPTLVVATRTLPFLPIAGDKGGTDEAIEPIEMQIVFSNCAESDHVTVTVPGYATAELKDVSAMYNLPSGLIR